MVESLLIQDEDEDTEKTQTKTQTKCYVNCHFSHYKKKTGSFDPAQISHNFGGAEPDQGAWQGQWGDSERGPDSKVCNPPQLIFVLPVLRTRKNIEPTTSVGSDMTDTRWTTPCAAKF